jgi:hypothetical protein
MTGIRSCNRRKAEEEAARSGRYALAEDAKQQMGRIASQMLNTFEGWLGEVASTVSGKFSLPQRDVLHLMRSEFRSFRVRASDALRHQAKQNAELVEDNLIQVDPVGDAGPGRMMHVDACDVGMVDKLPGSPRRNG